MPTEPNILYSNITAATPAGQDPWIKGQPSPNWPEPGIIPSLNTMWVRPGMLMEPGTDFASAQKLEALGQQQAMQEAMGEAQGFLDGGGGGRAAGPSGSGPNIPSLIQKVGDLAGSFFPSGPSAETGSPGSYGAQPDILRGTGGVTVNPSFLDPGIISGLSGGSIASGGVPAGFTGAPGAPYIDPAILNSPSYQSMLSGASGGSTAAAGLTGAESLSESLAAIAGPISQLLGGLGTAYGIGEGLSNIFGGTEETQGTQYGTAIGMGLGAFGGPVGMAIGSALGSLLGGLFNQPDIYGRKRAMASGVAEQAKEGLSQSLQSALMSGDSDRFLAALGTPGLGDAFGRTNTSAIALAPEAASIIGREVTPGAGGFEFNPYRGLSANLLSMEDRRKFVEAARQNPSVLELLRGSGDIGYLPGVQAEQLAQANRTNAMDYITHYLFGQGMGAPQSFTAPEALQPFESGQYSYLGQMQRPFQSSPWLTYSDIRGLQPGGPGFQSAAEAARNVRIQQAFQGHLGELEAIKRMIDAQAMAASAGGS